jgi:signal transduction histidine kinase
LVQISQLFTDPIKAQMVINRSSKKFCYRLSLTIKHRNGNLTDVLYNASVYKDDKAMFLSFAARDVTERKMFEKEMIDAKFLQKLLQSQTTVLSNMSHEIRTPLNSILGFTNVLLKPD